MVAAANRCNPFAYSIRLKQEESYSRRQTTPAVKMLVARVEIIAAMMLLVPVKVRARAAGALSK